MKKTAKKYIIFIFIIAVIAVILIVNYNTNYNWRYGELLKKLTDVPNKDTITGTDFYASGANFFVG